MIRIFPLCHGLLLEGRKSERCRPRRGSMFRFYDVIASEGSLPLVDPQMQIRAGLVPLAGRLIVASDRTGPDASRTVAGGQSVSCHVGHFVGSKLSKRHLDSRFHGLLFYLQHQVDVHRNLALQRVPE